MKKLKFIVFILLIVFLFILFSYSIFGNQISFLSVKEIKENRKMKKDLITELRINNVDTVYEKNKNIYYYMISEEHEDNIYVLNLELDDSFKYKLVDETLNIIKVNYQKPIRVIIYNDKYYFETEIQLTNLPLINIISKEEITSNDTETQFNYLNNNTENIITLNSLIHIRGASSKSFDKKSYKINFMNKTYTDEKDINISKFYYGDSLILDALYRDPSKIRNVLSTQIWNDISKKFTDTYIYSEFVEVFINNEYIGLYILTEPVNRTNLNLNKTSNTDTSVIVKTTDWRIIEETKEEYYITEDKFLGYELKYPNDSDKYEKSWDIVLNKLSNYYNNDNSYKVIKNTFNVENYIDLIIFNAFTNNTDNSFIKNNYLYIKSFKNNQIYIQPWDMEYTFGLLYDSEDEKLINKDITDYNLIYTKLIHENSDEINNLLVDRYWELRKSILFKEYFDNLLDNYKSQLNKGAAKRDSDIWYEYDVEKEIEEIREWIYNRLEFFDEYVKEIEND